MIGSAMPRRSVRKSTSSSWTSPSSGACRQSSGKSSRSARGSTTAPERAWLPISLPFSSTAIDELDGLPAPALCAAISSAEVVGAGQARRPGADEEDVDLQRLAFDLGHGGRDATTGPGGSRGCL